MSQHNLYTRPEFREVPNRLQIQQSRSQPPSPRLPHSSVLYGSTTSVPNVHNRYPPATFNGQYQQPMTRQSGDALLSPRNFMTLPINRNVSRTPLQLNAGNQQPTSTKTQVPSYNYYKGYTSPFGTTRRTPPRPLDKYPSVLTLNEVKITPIPQNSSRTARHSTSAVPSVLDRYPPAANDGIYMKSTKRNSAPPTQNKSTPSSPALWLKKENDFIANRFRYPIQPSKKPATDTTIRTASSSSVNPEIIPPPPPPLPMGQTAAPVKVIPPTPKRNPPNGSTLVVRKSSVNLKRTPSGRNQQRLGEQQTIQHSGSRKAPARPSQASRLLSQEENEMVWDILGSGRQSLSTAVVELLLPTQENRSQQWKLRDVAVLCFVRDPSKRSYFLEFLSLRMGRCIYACEIYEEFDYRAIQNSRFLSFEGQDCRVGINFADESEFIAFKDTLDKKIEARRKRRYDRQSKAFDIASEVNDEHIRPFQPKSGVKKSKSIFSGFSTIRSKKNKKKLGKRDIGCPIDFQHVSHAGYDKERGFQSFGDVGELLTKYESLLKEANVTKQQLKDPATRNFIYQFIENYENEAEEPNSKSKNPAPTSEINTKPLAQHPPPTASSQSQLRNIYSNEDYEEEPEVDYELPVQQKQNIPPPPPPSRMLKIPPPPPLPSGLSHTVSKSHGPPPPPPMPTDMSSEQTKKMQPTIVIPDVDYDQDVRSNLMKQIQEGAKGKLKHVDQSDASTQQRPVQGLAGALQRALAERSKAINPDSSESEDEGDSFDSEDWEDE